MSNEQKVINAVIEQYPSFDYKQMFDIDRAINWELWHGPLPSDYWSYVEPLDNYTWKGFDKAVSDIQELLSDMPRTLYWSSDAELLSDINPENDEENWFEDTSGNWEWCGFDYEIIDPLKFLLHKESFNQVF